jgi:hypothetical protein
VTRIVFVHGSVGNAELTWAAQRALGARFELVLLTRGGYPPGLALERIDFDEQVGKSRVHSAARRKCAAAAGSAAAGARSGHSLPRAFGYNDVLVDFVERA